MEAMRAETPVSSDERQILMRAMVWAIVGVIVAPLCIALDDLFRLAGLGDWSLLPAAALACGAGSIFYGARQVAIASSLIGVTAGSILLLIPGAAIALWQPAVVGLMVGIVGGYLVDFPERCTSHVIGRAAAGVASGAMCGIVLALVAPYVPLVREEAVSVAFLVSVTGVLYVSTLRSWVRIFDRIDATADRSKQAVVVGVVAMLTAASVWIVANSISGNAHSPMATTLFLMLESLPAALTAGMMAGGITGALLEIFGFRWIIDI